MKSAGILSLFIVILLFVPVMATFTGHIADNTLKPNIPPGKAFTIPLKQSEVVLSGFQKVGRVNSSMHLNVLITLGVDHQSLLNTTLNQLQNPSSPLYHRYLTASQFISEFSPSLQEYNSYVGYFQSHGLNITTTYADRLSIGISSNVSQLEKVFNTSISYFTANGTRFYAPSTPLSINADFGTISGVTGLSDRFTPSLSPMFSGSGSSQVLYGADLQNAYQLSKLYQSKGYPTGETIATILWSGTINGTSVAPFVPSDISTYLNSNLPSGEPRSKFYGLPVGGAPLPGSSAASDISNANIESTLDLEMAGSTAPGATLVEVYGPHGTMAYLDEAFAEILSPNYNTTLDNALSHVVAISNSWGGTDSYDSAWAQYEQEAAARGITVLASSGDNGNANSVAPSFPASFGYNSYGTLAVGGTQTVLSGTSSSNGTGTTGISSQSVWYNTPGIGDGSQGGVSTAYSEPSWQSNSTDANSVIRGAETITGIQSGRGTPDIAAVGANMLIYVTSDTYDGTGYQELWGTSVASPLVAGLIATIDSYLGRPEGFLNPFIYEIGQEQYQGTYAGPPPFYFIYNGSNAVFHSTMGYNLVDGWGSINAYNFVIAQENTYTVTFTEDGLPSGTEWSVNLSNGLSLSATASTVLLLLANGNYTYESSTPLYGYEAASGIFEVNGTPFSQNITFKYSAFAVNFSETGLPSGSSWYVNISGNSKSAPSGSPISYHLINGSYTYNATSQPAGAFVSVGDSFTVSGNASNVTVLFEKIYNVNFIETGLPVDIKWYVVLNGISNSNYSPGEIAFRVPNGTYAYNISGIPGYYPVLAMGTANVSGNNLSIYATFVNSKFSIVLDESGLPAGTPWYVNFTSGPGSLGTIKQETSGSTISIILPNGTYSYNVATGNKDYRSTGASFTVHGSGIHLPVYFNPVTYTVTFRETGLLSGVPWNLTVNGLRYESSQSTINLSKTNGTYSYTVNSTKDYTPLNQSGEFTVRGQNETFYLVFQRHYTISFTETGLPAQYTSVWGVYFNGTGYHISGNYFNLSVMNGTYQILSINNSLYYGVIESNFLIVNGSNQGIVIDYRPYAFINLNVYPANANVFIDGVLENTTNGYLNLSVLPGFHSVKVEENGYLTYYHNVTASGGNVIDLQVHLNSSSLKIPTVDLFLGIAGAAISIGVAVAYYYSRKKRQ